MIDGVGLAGVATHLAMLAGAGMVFMGLGAYAFKWRAE
jgi:hypothetical protein